MKQKLEQVRKTIDEIDDQIIGLIMRRLDLVREIGAIKEISDREVDDPEREAEIVDRLQGTISGRLSVEEIRTVFGPIFSLAKNIQKNR